MHRLIIINPGSTSTKIGVFEDENLVFENTIRHTVEELKGFARVHDQLDFRKEIILKNLEVNHIVISEIDAVIGRGGLVKPIESGTYEVNELMLEHLRIGYMGEHASNLGGLLAFELARDIGCNAYIVDPVVVDELQPVARISGLKEIERVSIFHALNHKAIARRYAKVINRGYEDLRLVVVHLGGGVSVGAHEYGKVIECANALDGEGPFSPERSGTLPVGSLIKLCYSGKYTYHEMKKLLTGMGGMVSYLGTNDAREVVKRIKEGDEEAKLIYQAMAYQISKEIGAVSVVLKGQIDAILLTGGMAYDDLITEWIKDMVKFIAPVEVFPGEDELLALCEGGLRVLRNEEKAKMYFESEALAL
ncbi:butyrate kinase [Tissierella sp. Yu-01]|uniref:butyrate kinase n=1 Tax=Tissierella sp. Yu-01 TaxID=3035694 RepID=UPI00240D6D7B|nr:butyrate kinase [Tissierella sp. Yu-01]WFA10308.1 butyrate kinase [Tissierella sp. Yu-01]